MNGAHRTGRVVEHDQTEPLSADRTRAYMAGQIG